MSGLFFVFLVLPDSLLCESSNVSISFTCDLISKPFNLSTFNLDEYENALRHSVVDPPCQLISEVHASLLHVVKELPPNRHSISRLLASNQFGDGEGAERVRPNGHHANGKGRGRESMMEVDGEEGGEVERERRKWEQADSVLDVTVGDLAEALSGFGNGWEKTPLREKDGRKGWETTLVGCLRDVRITLRWLLLKN